MVLIFVANGHSRFAFGSYAKNFKNFEFFFLGVPKFLTKFFCFKISSFTYDWKEYDLSVKLPQKLKPYHL